MIVRRMQDIAGIPDTANKVRVVRCLTRRVAESLLNRCPRLKRVTLTRFARKRASKKALDCLLSAKIDLICDSARQGRPVGFSRVELMKMRLMREKGFSYERIASFVGISQGSVFSALKGYTKFHRWREDYDGRKERVVWMITRDGDPDGRKLADNHYSRKTKGAKFFCGPGEKLVLITPDKKALFVWRRNKVRWDGQKGVECAMFRNEGAGLSSALIKEAVKLARKRWLGERLFTYVRPDRIKSTDPGFCFKKAGWRVVGTNRGRRKLLILEAPAPRRFA